jgi:hypothetical protein
MPEMDKVMELFKKPEASKMLRNMAVAGGAAGLGAGMLSAGRRSKPDEDASERRGRILRDALGAAVLGAGGAGALTYGMENFTTALPVEDTNPAADLFRSPASRGAMGGAGYLVTDKLHTKPRRDMVAGALIGNHSDKNLAGAVFGKDNKKGPFATLQHFFDQGVRTTDSVNLAGEKVKGPLLSSTFDGDDIRILKGKGMRMPGERRSLRRFARGNKANLAAFLAASLAPEIIGLASKGYGGTKSLLEGGAGA